jgi:hypothetical protein
MIRKKGWLNTHVLPPMSAGVLREYATPSTDQVTAPGSQSTANVWNASAKACPPARLNGAPTPFPPEYPGPWIVPCTVDGSNPTFSMMSISPMVGQPPEPLPSIQNAGHMPCPRGSFMRASKRP